MGDAQNLPSFSVILETENLANADIEGLSKSLASLANQDLSLTQANEVLVIDGGNAPPDLLHRLQTQYPWITLHRADSITDYYQAKMYGAGLATGEIIVYADSDCIYEQHWLRTMLQSFCCLEKIDVVAGETTTRGLGLYGTAMALVYIFPPYSGEKSLIPTRQYFLNNVAFRRQVLLQHPIPLQLPLYRGNCVLHAHHLCRDGIALWRQPQARATHAPPYGLAHFFWRFLLIGHDYYWQRRLLATTDADGGSYRDPVTGKKNQLIVFGQRLLRMLRHQPWHLLFLPLAIPIAGAAVLLIAIGYAITALRPNYLLDSYDKLQLSLGQQSVAINS